MGTRTPDRHEIMNRSLPVRLKILNEGRAEDWANHQVTTWLRRNVGEGNYGMDVGPASFSGKRTVLIFLPSVFDAASLLLACPQLRLVRERYSGPMR